jgi:5-methyltetrahydrofolate--homocysteine methyltransferase
MLAARGHEDRFELLNRNAVAATVRAAAGQAHVGGSIGPCGQILQPFGDADPGAVAESFRRQIALLASAGVTMLLVETMIDLQEAQLALRAAREVAPDLPVLATMTFDLTPRGFFTLMGNPVDAAMAGLAEAGATIVGSNCGNGSTTMVQLAREIRAATQLPVAIQPNAGLPEHREGQLVHPETPEEMTGHARELLQLGVQVLGGCCGTTPAHTRALRTLLENGVRP